MNKTVVTTPPAKSPVALTALLVMMSLPALAETPNALPSPPDQLLGPLYAAVQQAQIFPDQKTFADAVPNADPASIVADWQMQKRQRNFDLKRFVSSNFTLPADSKPYSPPAGQNLRDHIDTLWPVLTRRATPHGRYDSLLALPQPYVVPGGRFREVYYWDSYFTMLGLAESGHWDRVREMVDNFAFQLDSWGHIPNGNRSYYLSRSQPPFFSLMLDLLASRQGEATYRHYLPQLQKEYDYWMAGSDSLAAGQADKRIIRLADGTLLNRYWDERDAPRTESWLQDVNTAKSAPQRQAGELYRDLRAGAASGWDFSSRWFSDAHRLATIRITQLAPVDLNSLLFHLEQTLAKAYRLDAKPEQAAHFTQLASQRQAAINRYLWDDKQGWYADYDRQQGRVTTQLTAATLFPLYMQLAGDRQAQRTADAVGKQLLKAGGLLTTTLNSGQQWDAPNGWAPLQWVAVEGLEHYRQPSLARQIGVRFLQNVQTTYDRQHKLVEKYVVDGPNIGGGGGGGEYPLQDGFGWTNGVTLMLLDKYCAPGKRCSSASDIIADATTK